MEAVLMAEGMIVALGFVAVASALCAAGVIYERLRHAPAPPFRWSDAEHEHAVIMSRYYRKFGPEA